MLTYSWLGTMRAVRPDHALKTAFRVKQDPRSHGRLPFSSPKARPPIGSVNPLPLFVQSGSVVGPTVLPLKGSIAGVDSASVGSDTRKPSRRVLVAVGVYALFYVLLVIAFVIDEGVDGDPRKQVPYWAVFGVLYGLAIGRWWILPFPALQLFIVVPLWYALQSTGPVTYSYDRGTVVLAGTLGIAGGLLVHALLRSGTRRSERQP